MVGHRKPSKLNKKTRKIRLKYKAFSQIQNLGNDFYDVVIGATYPKHILRFRNNVWAAHVGLDKL
jgi:hypothetical protein